MKDTLIFCVYLFIGCLLSQSLCAQCSIAGKVTNKEGQPLPYTSVQLLRTDSGFVSGTTTDTLGHYQFTKADASPYLMVFTSIGYKKRVISITPARGKNELSPVVMETDNIELNEVVVRGASVIRQKDRLLILPDKQQIKQAGTGYDLLYNLMIPGMEVDRAGGTVKTFGGEATLYIDGRKAEYREVQSLRPKDIEKIEYFDVPTGKYADDVAAINYVTRQYKSGGYVAIDGRQTVGYLHGDYNIVGKLSKGNMSYTLFAGHSMDKHNGDLNENHEHFVFPEYEVDRETRTLDSKVKNNSQYMQLNIANQSKRHHLSGKISFVRNDAPDNYKQEALEYNSGEHTTKQTSVRATEQSGHKPAIELYGYFDLKNNQFAEVSLSGNYADNQYSYHYQEDEYSTLTHTQEDLYGFFANVKYGMRWKERNALSFRATHYHMVSSSHYDGEHPSWQHLWTGETLFYAEYRREIGKNLAFQVSPGFSSLQYRLHGEKLINQYKPRLSTNLVYRIAGRHQLVFNAELSGSSPVIAAFNNVEQEVDALIVKRGNSQLDNNIFGVIDFSYSGQFKNFGLYARLNYIRVGHVIATDYHTEQDKLIKTFRSDVSANEHQGMLSATWKVSEHFRLKMDGYWSVTSTLKGIADRSDNLTGLVQMDYYLKNFSCSLYGKTGYKSFSDDMIHRYEPAKYGLSVHWSHKNWLVEAGTESPFTKHRRWKQSLAQDAYSYTNHITGRAYQQTGFVKVIYTYDFGKKTSRDNNDVNRSIDSGILKAY